LPGRSLAKLLAALTVLSLVPALWLAELVWSTGWEPRGSDVTIAAVVLANDNLVFASLALGMALLPLATGAAILRHRLYDLDRIISRTLAYGLLSVLLGLGYASVVLSLGRLLSEQGSSLAVDRRFNRRRHDAARTIQAFSGRLREQVDLDTLTAELLAVTDRTVEPTMVWLWLRPPAEPMARPSQ
jgi:hypothetical protein